MKSSLQGAIRRNMGYTIDQTILIVAVIAVFDYTYYRICWLGSS